MIVPYTIKCEYKNASTLCDLSFKGTKTETIRNSFKLPGINFLEHSANQYKIITKKYILVKMTM